MIRQAISCDVCGNEKRQTNHWFVAYEQAGELRVAGWSSRNRLRAGTKHLCGQTCLHKLLDDFMARAIGHKTQTESDTSVVTAALIHETNHSSSASAGTDASLTSKAAYDAVESSARLITPAVPSLPTITPKPSAEMVTFGGKKWIDTVIPPIAIPPIPIPSIEDPRYASRTRRAEAWERERERESRGQDCGTDLARRRAGGR